MTGHARISLLAMLLLTLPAAAAAQSTCQFSDVDNVRVLLADCRTETSIEIRDGEVLDGNTHTIIAVDPPGGFFQGPIVLAKGRTASIINTHVTAELQANVCPEGAARLRGIYFDGASGEISGNTVDEIHRSPSACEEGNAIEVRHRVGDTFGSVMIRGNYIQGYQKTGVVVHGHVQATVRANFIGGSVGTPPLAANGIQVGPLAIARIEQNQISGVFSGDVLAGSAILLIESGGGTVVDDNDITGDPDVGIHVVADGATVTNNHLIDTGPAGRYDIGIVNLGAGNVFVNNLIIGFRTSMYGVETNPAPVPRGSQVE